MSVTEPTWPQALTRYPFAAALLPTWRAHAAELPEAYQAALDAALAAFDPDRPLDERYRHLLDSRARLTALTAEGDTHIATQFLRIRVHRACGEPQTAQSLTEALLQQLQTLDADQAQQAPLLDRPFLPALEFFDPCVVNNPQDERERNDWVLALALDTAEFNATSRHAQPAQHLSRLAQRRKLPCASIESERMLALAVLRLGKKVTIKSESRLLLEGKNTEHWALFGEEKVTQSNVQKRPQKPVANHQESASFLPSKPQHKGMSAPLRKKVKSSSEKENSLLSLLRKANKNELAEAANILMPFVADAELRQMRVWGDRSRLHLENITIPVNDLLINTRSGHVTIKENCFFGHRCMLLTGTHDYNKTGIDRLKAVPNSGRDIILEKGVWLGSDVTVLGPAHIGENAVVAAGSLVTKDVEANTIVAGRPANPVKKIQIDESSQRLKAAKSNNSRIDKLLEKVNSLHKKGKESEAKEILHKTFRLKKSLFSADQFFKKSGIIERVGKETGDINNDKKVLILGSKPNAYVPKDCNLVFGANSSISYYFNDVSDISYKFGVWGPIGIESLSQLSEGGVDEIITLGDKPDLFEEKFGYFSSEETNAGGKKVFYSVLSFAERREIIGEVVGRNTPFFHNYFFSISYQHQYQLLKHCFDFKLCYEQGIKKIYDWPLPLRPSSGIFSLIIAAAIFKKNAKYSLAGIGTGMKNDTRYIHPTRLGDTAQGDRMIKNFGLDAHVTADLEIIELLNKKYKIATTDFDLSETANIAFES